MSWGFELQIVPPDMMPKALKRGKSNMTDKEDDRPEYKIEDGRILARVTKDMLEDPKEPGIPLLQAATRELEAEFFDSGVPVYRCVGYSQDRPKYHASFIPRKKQTKGSDKS